MTAPAGGQTGMSRVEWGLLFFLSVLWGGSFFFVGIIIKALPPLTIVVCRVSLAALVLLVVIRLMGLSMPRNVKVWRAFFGMGLLNNVIPFSLIVWGQGQIPAGLAAILNATTPLFALIIAHYVAPDERISFSKIAGLLLGFAGVVVMIWPSVHGGAEAPLLAQLAVLGAAVSYACAGVFGRRFKSMGVAPLPTAAGQLCAATMMLLPVALLVDHPWQLAMPAPVVWLAIGLLAIFSTALAYIIYFRILATAGAVNILLVTLLVPVSAILLSWLFLGEHLAPRHILGMGLIAAGLLAIDGRLPRTVAATLRR